MVIRRENVFTVKKVLESKKVAIRKLLRWIIFFPHTLLNELPEINVNGVWNLVLACQECNRGTGGKFERIPKIQFLERLHARNEYLIDSHHPLRETIINQTGKDTPKRIKFLQQIDQKAIDIIPTRWSPPEAHEG